MYTCYVYITKKYIYIYLDHKRTLYIQTHNVILFRYIHTLVPEPHFHPSGEIQAIHTMHLESTKALFSKPFY